MHLLLLAASLALPKEPAEWIMLAPSGTWRGHPTAPGGFTLGRAELDEMVRNFQADPRGRVVCDYEHQTLKAAENGKPAPASGWITAVEVRDGPEGPALWGKPQWTQSADTAIRGAEYAYVSPVIVFRSKDRVSGQPSGTRLHSVALTNNPFFQEMPAIAARLDLEDPPMLTLLCALLALPPTSKEEEALAEVKKRDGERKLAFTALGLPETATADQVQVAFNDLRRQAAVGKAVLDELKVPATDTAEAATARVLPVLKHAGYVAASEHQATLTELAKLKADGLVGEAVTAGKVIPATEGWARAFAAENPEGFKAWAKVAPVVAPPAQRSRTAPPPINGSSSTLTAEEAAVCSQLGLSSEQYLKARAEES